MIPERINKKIDTQKMKKQNIEIENLKKENVALKSDLEKIKKQLGIK